MMSDRLYEQLTPLERLRATVSAKARGDQVERDRLVDTCVENNYKALDWEFTGRAEKLHLMALAHGNGVHRLAFQTTMMMSYLLVIEHDLPETAELNDEQQARWDCYESVTAKIHALCAIVDGWERGFERFCDALGFDVKEVRKTYGIARVNVMDGTLEPPGDFPMITIGELDQEAVMSAAQKRYEYYCEVWAKDFRRDLGADLRSIATEERKAPEVEPAQPERPPQAAPPVVSNEVVLTLPNPPANRPEPASEQQHQSIQRTQSVPVTDRLAGYRDNGLPQIEPD